MLPAFATDTIVVLRASGAIGDAHGQNLPDWATAGGTTVAGCSVQPGATDEILAGRDTVTIDYTAYVPPDTDVKATDRVVFGADTFTVVGEPLRWRSPSGRLDHTVVPLRRFVEHG